MPIRRERGPTKPPRYRKKITESEAKTLKKKTIKSATAPPSPIIRRRIVNDEGIVQPDPEDLRIISEFGGYLSHANLARTLGVHVNTLREWFSDTEGSVSVAYQIARRNADYAVIQAIQEKVLDGDPEILKLMAKTRLGWSAQTEEEIYARSQLAATKVQTQGRLAMLEIRQREEELRALEMKNKATEIALNRLLQAGENFTGLTPEQQDGIYQILGGGYSADMLDPARNSKEEK